MKFVDDDDDDDDEMSLNLKNAARVTFSGLWIQWHLPEVNEELVFVSKLQVKVQFTISNLLGS